MKCFKVVRREILLSATEGEKLISAMNPAPFRTEYAVGKKSTAPDFLAERGYHLFAFETREDADYFCYKMWTAKHLIFEAKGTELLSPPVYLNPSHWDDGWPDNPQDNLEWLIDNHACRPTVSEPSMVWPVGTLMFKTIELIKEL